VGKGTLVEKALSRRPDLWLSRSWTTRARRPGEAADAYIFVTREQFTAQVAAGGFLEWTELAANHQLYGTPWPAPPEGRDVLLEIDLAGAAQVLDRHPDAVVVLVVAPSPEVQAQRMRARGDDEEHVAQRLELGAHEERVGRTLASHVVVNDDLDRAVDDLAGILDSHRKPPAGAAPCPRADPP